MERRDIPVPQPSTTSTLEHRPLNRHPAPPAPVHPPKAGRLRPSPALPTHSGQASETARKGPAPPKRATRQAHATSHVRRISLRGDCPSWKDPSETRPSWGPCLGLVVLGRAGTNGKRKLRLKRLSKQAAPQDGRSRGQLLCPVGPVLRTMYLVSQTTFVDDTSGQRPKWQSARREPPVGASTQSKPRVLPPSPPQRVCAVQPYEAFSAGLQGFCLGSVRHRDRDRR